MGNKQVWDDRACRNLSFIMMFRWVAVIAIVSYQLVSILPALILVEWPNTSIFLPCPALRSFDSCPVHGLSCGAWEIALLWPLSSGNTNMIPGSDFALLVAGMSSSISSVSVSDIPCPGINSHATPSAPEPLRQAYEHNFNKKKGRSNILHNQRRKTLLGCYFTP